jgi:hypothetical protein
MDAGVNVKDLLQTSLPWLFPIFQLAAAVICFTAIRASSRVVVLGIGFLFAAVAAVGNRLVFHFLVQATDGPRDFEKIGQYNMILAGVGLVAWVIIIVGLALVFADVRRRLDSRAGYGPPRDRDDSRPWRPRQEGSHDIQP